jgi:PIN domain nuclease of toxin-antitoxin system
VRLLLDTHTFLWFVLGDMQLSTNARTLIENVNNEKLISPAIYWELAIKISIGKYVLSEPYEDFLDRGITQNGFLILPIEPQHTAKPISLPFHHRDPFDRLIIAQALTEGIPVISADAAFDNYPVQRLW